jgi:hypothetical protein
VSDGPDLIQAAADLAKAASAGKEPSPAVIACLRAIAATQDEQQRHEAARQAAERAGEITDYALGIIRTLIFHLP